MFSKGKKTEQPKSNTNNAPGRSLSVPKLTSPGVAPSIVSANLRVTGDLESDGDIQIDGAVDGDVRSKSVTVGEHAVVSGAIVAQTVHVSGTVKGQINGKVVELMRSAKVTGDVVHESLAIEAGAFIQGLCRHAEGSGQLLGEVDGGGQEQPTPNLVVDASDGKAADRAPKANVGVAASGGKG
ncbi:MAG: polymer-forming cytoskeletal protein [Alphaproteobacteria bacterium]|nr:polymer-forming cytoskeletal protein [Alphaproteobacteria bacterium]